MALSHTPAEVHILEVVIHAIHATPIIMVDLILATLALHHVAPLAPHAILAHALVDSHKAVQQD